MKKRSQICVSLLTPYLAQAEALGFPREQLLTELGLNEALFSKAMQRIAFRDFLLAVQRLVHITQRADIGLLSGEHFHPSTLGPLSYLMMNSDSIGEAYRGFLRYEALINEAVETRLEVKDGLIFNSERYNGYSDEETAPLVEADFSAMMGYTQFLSFRPDTDKPTPLRVDFRHQPLTAIEHYEKRFAAEVRFGQPHNVIVFDAAIMDYRIPGADARIVTRAIAELDAIQLALRGERRFVTDVYDFIKEGFYSEIPSAKTSAEHFAMSVSTFQRRLREEGSSFKQLVEQVRKDKAEVYLRDLRIPLADIGERLGFSDTPAFFKAFRRWSGKTPAEYRKQLADDDHSNIGNDR
jgi:AraC-like DNA-binding protein